MPLLAAVTIATASVTVSPARDPRDQVDLAAVAERRVVGVLVDHAIDRDRHAVLDLAAEAGEALVELEHEAAEGLSLHLELGLAAREPAHRRAREVDLRHVAYLPFSSMAARSFGGDIGRLGIRTPMASRIAFATAAIGGTIGTSPTPRAPKGCLGFGTSTSTASIIGRSEATGTR